MTDPTKSIVQRFLDAMAEQEDESWPPPLDDKFVFEMSKEHFDMESVETIRRVTMWVAMELQTRLKAKDSKVSKQDVLDTAAAVFEEGIRKAKGG